MISKELLSEVLGLKLEEFIEVKDNAIVYRESLNQGTIYQQRINIHELAHKVKEWAYTKGIELESGLKYCNYYNGACDEPENLIDYMIANSEPEAIFKAGQWILENKDV